MLTRASNCAGPPRPRRRIAGTAAGVLAIVSDVPLPGETLPVLPRDDVPAIADFILSSVGLPEDPRRRLAPVGAPSAATRGYGPAPSQRQHGRVSLLALTGYSR